MNPSSPTTPPAPSNLDQPEESPGLGRVLACWWRERVRILVHGLSSLAVVMVLVGAVFFLRTTQQHTTVVFRLLFKGAEKGLYPNGMQFTPDDIVSTPVLEEVYRRNSLDKFCKFEEFKSSFAVININPAIERLRRSFAGQLEDRKLSPVDRQKLETEYENRMKSLQNGEFTLVFQQTGAMASWPTTLTGKVIDDILNVWAEQSRSRGVYKFDLSIFSTNILDDLSASAYDYSVYLDRIRLSIDRILGNLRLLSDIPGASLVRVGEKQVSLGEMDAALRDHLNFELREISAIIYSFGLFREPVLTEAYLREQLFRLDVEQKEILARNDGMKRILEGYGGRVAAGQSAGGASGQGSGSLMPQLSDGFLERIIEMSGQGSENKFRQEIFQKIIDNEQQMYAIDRERQIYLRSLESMTNTARAAGTGEIKQVVDQRLGTLLGRLRSSLQNVALLHAELSNRNLQPSLVFSVVEPIQQVSSSSVRLTRLLFPLVLGWMAYMGLVLAGLSRRLL